MLPDVSVQIRIRINISYQSYQKRIRLLFNQ